MSATLKDTYGKAHHRPLAAAIAKKGGLLGREGIATDAAGKVDPLELAVQRGARELAADLLRAIGWELELKPPLRAARKSSAKAESDGGGER